MRESRFFQNCGTFNTNQNKKYHNFERNEIRATVFLKWTDFRLCLHSPHDHFNVPCLNWRELLVLYGYTIDRTCRGPFYCFIILFSHTPCTTHSNFPIYKISNIQRSRDPSTTMVYCSKTETTIEGTTGSYTFWRRINISRDIFEFLCEVNCSTVTTCLHEKIIPLIANFHD